MDHRAGEKPGIAEKLRGRVEPAGGQRLANRLRRDRPAAILQRRHHVDGKAAPFALRGEKVRRTGAVGAEMKVKADGRSAHGETLDQDAPDEIFRGKVCQRLVERKHNGAVQPGGSEQAQFGRRVGQPEQRFGGMEEGSRVRLEGQRRGRPAKRLGPLPRRRDHRLMAAVHAVEIADGDDRAGKRLIWRAGGRGSAHDAEILRRHRGCDG